MEKEHRTRLAAADGVAKAAKGAAAAKVTELPAAVATVSVSASVAAAPGFSVPFGDSLPPHLQVSRCAHSACCKGLGFVKGFSLHKQHVLATLLEHTTVRVEGPLIRVNLFAALQGR